MKRAVLLLSLTLSCLSFSWLPASADEKYAMELYKYGNYIDAAAEFKKLVDAHPDNLKYSYYYADCLLRRGKRSEALARYRAIYKAAPRSQLGKYSLRVLKTYKVMTVTPSPVSGGTQGAGARNKGAGSNIVEFDKGRPVATAGSAGQAAVDSSQQEKEIIAKLPRIQKLPAETPTLQEISTWPLFNQANYYAAAAERLERAQLRVRQAEELKARAYQVAYSAVGSQRRFGETEEETRNRVEASKDRTDRLLAPYDENIKYYTDIVSSEQSILNLCDRARNTYVPFPGTYYPPGWR